MNICLHCLYVLLKNVYPYLMPLCHLLLYSLVSQHSIKRILISTVDPDDPLAELLDDLLPDETKPKSKSSVQQAKIGKSASAPSASPILKTETREP